MGKEEDDNRNNKNDVIRKQNVILAGNSIGDAACLLGIRHEHSLSFGFLHEEVVVVVVIVVVVQMKKKYNSFWRIMMSSIVAILPTSRICWNCYKKSKVGSTKSKNSNNNNNP